MIDSSYFDQFVNNEVKIVPNVIIFACNCFYLSINTGVRLFNTGPY